MVTHCSTTEIDCVALGARRRITIDQLDSYLHSLKPKKAVYVLQRAFVLHRPLRRKSLGGFDTTEWLLMEETRRIVTNTECLVYLVPDLEAAAGIFRGSCCGNVAIKSQYACRVSSYTRLIEMVEYFPVGQGSSHPLAQNFCQLTKHIELNSCKKLKKSASQHTVRLFGTSTFTVVYAPV